MGCEFNSLKRSKKMNYNTMHTWGSNPYLIGWEKVFSRFEESVKNVETAFPPYNLRKIDEDKFVIELAVAGFSKNDISVTEQDGNLIVKGEKPDTEESYLHKGIAGRKFTKTFSLAEHMEVTGADIKDGILYIGVRRNIPEHKLPKTIEITNFEEGRKRK
jgi:molecular chaperone IbpA